MIGLAVLLLLVSATVFASDSQGLRTNSFTSDRTHLGTIRQSDSMSSEESLEDAVAQGDDELFDRLLPSVKIFDARAALRMTLKPVDTYMVDRILDSNIWIDSCFFLRETIISDDVSFNFKKHVIGKLVPACDQSYYAVALESAHDVDPRLVIVVKDARTPDSYKTS